MFQNSCLSVSPDASDAACLGALRVGLIGTGVVGSGTCQVLQRNAELIAQRAGRPIRLVMATARNLHKAAQVVGPGVALVSDPWVLVRHPGIDVVVEVMGGVGLAKDLVLEAIAQGKHVVTANKALLAEHGAEIFAAADACGVVVAYEAAVAVSIPIIKALREGLAANRIHELVGIVNGTSNFILTKMQDEGLSFAAAVRLATELGYAEADPSFDVEGIDAAHKTALLAANAFGADVPFARVHAQGITALDPWDMVCAEALGYRIKLLGIARQCADAIEVRVHPTLVPQAHWLAQVQGSMNGIWVSADAAGPTFHYGAGAGSQTTASAVVADLIDVARCGAAGDAGRAALRVPHRSVQPAALRRWPVMPIGQVTSRHYLRFELGGHPALEAEWPSWLQAHGVELQHMAQVTHPEQAHRKAWVGLTASMRGDDLTRALASLSEQTGGPAAAAVLRVEDLA
ncbi:homoserine dehydrogenase [Limnohabitans sp.]|uniref:homoserine dehydrogenase n=1 Tax=Limnohabitans sp. TaxID=1907725 RepID=UPI0037BF5D0A